MEKQYNFTYYDEFANEINVSNDKDLTQAYEVANNSLKGKLKLLIKSINSKDNSDLDKNEFKGKILQKWKKVKEEKKTEEEMIGGISRKAFKRLMKKELDQHMSKLFENLLNNEINKTDLNSQKDEKFQCDLHFVIDKNAMKDKRSKTISKEDREQRMKAKELRKEEREMKREEKREARELRQKQRSKSANMPPRETQKIKRAKVVSVPTEVIIGIPGETHDAKIEFINNTHQPASEGTILKGNFTSEVSDLLEDVQIPIPKDQMPSFITNSMVIPIKIKEQAKPAEELIASFMFQGPKGNNFGEEFQIKFTILPGQK